MVGIHNLCSELWEQIPEKSMVVPKRASVLTSLPRSNKLSLLTREQTVQGIIGSIEKNKTLESFLG